MAAAEAAAEKAVDFAAGIKAHDLETIVRPALDDVLMGVQALADTPRVRVYACGLSGGQAKSIATCQSPGSGRSMCSRVAVRAAQHVRILAANLLTGAIAQQISEEQIIARFEHPHDHVDEHALAGFPAVDRLAAHIRDRHFEDAQRAMSADLALR